jgi:hypothetical protein
MVHSLLNSTSVQIGVGFNPRCTPIPNPSRRRCRARKAGDAKSSRGNSFAERPESQEIVEHFEPPWQLSATADAHYQRVARQLYQQGRWQSVAQDLVAGYASFKEPGQAPAACCSRSEVECDGVQWTFGGSSLFAYGLCRAYAASRRGRRRRVTSSTPMSELIAKIPTASRLYSATSSRVTPCQIGISTSPPEAKCSVKIASNSPLPPAWICEKVMRQYYDAPLAIAQAGIY